VNDFIVAYHLLYDARRHPLYADEVPRSTMENSEQQNLREGEITFQLEEGGAHDQSLLEAGFNNVAHKKWFLGVLSGLTPTSIMNEVLRALKETGFEWKITGPYQLRCLTKIGTRGTHVKVMIQLFKVSEQKFLLDVKKIEGETFPFFDVCSRFLDELHV